MNEIQKLTEEYHNAVKSIQDRCKHRYLEKTYKSDTGNWCKADDRYWIEYKCPECLKSWEEEK